MAFTATTANSAYPFRPDQTVFAAVDVVPDALLMSCSTIAGAIEGDQPSVRCGYLVDDEATFVAEASEIPEAEPSLAECVVYTAKASQLIRVSREQYYQEGTADQLAQSTARALVRKCDEAFIDQAIPTPPAVQPAAGLLHIPGTVQGDEVSGSLDALVDLIAEIQSNLGRPSVIVLGVQAWAELRKLKTGVDFNSSLLGAGVTDATPLLLGLPLIVNPNVPADTGIVIDKTAVVSAVGPVLVDTSADFYFNRDEIALRATWRFGQNLVRPNRVGVFTVAGAGS